MGCCCSLPFFLVGGPGGKKAPGRLERQTSWPPYRESISDEEASRQASRQRSQIQLQEEQHSSQYQLHQQQQERDQQQLQKQQERDQQLQSQPKPQDQQLHHQQGQPSQPQVLDHENDHEPAPGESAPPSYDSIFREGEQGASSASRVRSPKGGVPELEGSSASDLGQQAIRLGQRN